MGAHPTSLARSATSAPESESLSTNDEGEYGRISLAPQSLSGSMPLAISASTLTSSAALPGPPSPASTASAGLPGPPSSASTASAGLPGHPAPAETDSDIPRTGRRLVCDG
eukprot:CAMPEP_0117672550 /NCGR_PEP_ID=MMETSP0804-20121206/13967_1 /TAXON_ID=1074897 /ORGANISM="Tetraselmis astigmatica, Strain CCMP880" /LENGTH=110 /DNA_ID=CAMNT_0005481165 /DNA_START=1307 /DNA_END=1639 /DNA_ORIENTATION=+